MLFKSDAVENDKECRFQLQISKRPPPLRYPLDYDDARGARASITALLLLCLLYLVKLSYILRSYAVERLFESLRYKATSSVILSGAIVILNEVKNLRPFVCAQGDRNEMLR